MAELLCPDIMVYVCGNCLADTGRLPRQWRQNDSHVLVRETPCSGNIDAQYLMHALESCRGLCVVACPKGACKLAQGNYRAEVRVRTVRRLLAEIGLDAGRVEMLHCPPNGGPEQVEQLVREAVDRINALKDGMAAAAEVR